MTDADSLSILAAATQPRGFADAINLLCASLFLLGCIFFQLVATLPSTDQTGAMELTINFFMIALIGYMLPMPLLFLAAPGWVFRVQAGLFFVGCVIFVPGLIYFTSSPDLAWPLIIVACSLFTAGSVPSLVIAVRAARAAPTVTYAEVVAPLIGSIGNFAGCAGFLGFCFLFLDNDPVDVAIASWGWTISAALMLLPNLMPFTDPILAVCLAKWYGAQNADQSSALAIRATADRNI